MVGISKRVAIEFDECVAVVGSNSADAAGLHFERHAARIPAGQRRIDVPIRTKEIGVTVLEAAVDDQVRVGRHDRNVVFNGDVQASGQNEHGRRRGPSP